MTPTLVGIPYDRASSFLRGAAAAPALIRRELASDAGNGVSEALIDLRAPGALADAGDIDLRGDQDPQQRISDALTRVLEGGARPISLGGDHSVTFPIVRAVRPHWPTLTILQIDAHPDLYDAFDGDRFSHACPFARIMEAGLADHLVQVGIRAMNQRQAAQADRFGVEVIDMRAWTTGARPVVRGPVYVSVDIDGLDPAFAPGVSHREPGGSAFAMSSASFKRWTAHSSAPTSSSSIRRAMWGTSRRRSARKSCGRSPVEWWKPANEE